MNPEFFRRFAERIRELIMRARTDAAKEQLRVWAEEFEAHAASLETHEPASMPLNGSCKPPN